MQGRVRLALVLGEWAELFTPQVVNRLRHQQGHCLLAETRCSNLVLMFPVGVDSRGGWRGKVSLNQCIRLQRGRKPFSGRLNNR